MIKSFTLKALAQRYGGEFLGRETHINTLSTDTRSVQAADLLVALKGEHFDAHNYLQQAFDKGVRAFVIENAALEKLPKDEQNSLWLVDDTIAALGNIAQYQREFFTKPLVAITGSSGKTSVKGMLADIFSCYVGKQNVFATKGNFNNHIGVPLSLLELNGGHQYAVIEMGASGPGEIAYLTAMAKPTHALINNVMPAHVEGFGSVDGIARAKGEIYQGLHENGCAIINGDDTYAEQWLQSITQRNKIIFSPSGNNAQAQVFAKNSRLLSNGCYSFCLTCGEEALVVKLNVLGLHNVANAVAAATCAYALGMDIQFIRKGLERFSAEKGRLQIVKGLCGSTLIDDTYNANPGSMRAAINVLAEATDHSVFVMGDMGELGEAVDEQHRQIGVYAKDKNIKYFLTLGKHSEYAARAYGEGAQHFASIDSLIQRLHQLVLDHPVILVKGSRSSRMERVIDALTFAGDDNASLAC